jgi:dTDP-4-amino-4,6-dideoxygalactose transaminase
MDMNTYRDATDPADEPVQPVRKTGPAVPAADLRQQYLNHRKALDTAIRKACESGEFILGAEVQRFETRFASYLGIQETVGVASGTDALRIAAHVLGIGPGDEVLIPANSFIATALAIHLLGATPVLVDVDLETALIDLNDAYVRLTSRTKAIIPVHLYGRCLDMRQVMTFARDHRLIVIEDACQAHGAAWQEKRAGTFGSAGCFSFYPSKNLGAFGDAGLIATSDSLLADKLRMYRNYGSVRKYHHEIAGENSRLDSLQAAVLNVKLDYLNLWNDRRREAAVRYIRGLSSLSSVVRTPAFDANIPSGHVFHQFVVQCQRRDALLLHLDRKGIQAGIHYPIPIHLHPAFAHLGLRSGDLPRAEQLARNALSLPLFPEITDDQIDFVVAMIQVFYE